MWKHRVLFLPEKILQKIILKEWGGYVYIFETQSEQMFRIRGLSQSKPSKNNSNMIHITNYQIKKKNNAFVIVPEEPIYCECGSKVLKRGSKERYLINNDGVRNRFILKRVYCPACNKLHMVMPDFIEPYKQYNKNVIDGVRNGTNDCSAADNATLYRWKKS